MAAPVAFFSLEMSAEQLGTRILSEKARIDSNSIRQWQLSSEEFDRLIEASDALSTTPFFIDDTPSLSVSQVASRARRMKRTTGLGLIVIDYLQLLMPQLGVRRKTGSGNFKHQPRAESHGKGAGRSCRRSHSCHVPLSSARTSGPIWPIFASQARSSRTPMWFCLFIATNIISPKRSPSAKRMKQEDYNSIFAMTSTASVWKRLTTRPRSLSANSVMARPA